MTVGNNPVDRRIKLGTKRHILTDKNGIPLSTVITSASTHDIKAVTNVIDHSVSHRPLEHLSQIKIKMGCIIIYTSIEHIVLNQ